MCDFARLAAPLTALLAKKTPWHFVKRELCAFKSLKKALYNPPCLALPCLDLPFSMQCDVSDFAIGAILSWDLGNRPQPVQYFSRKLDITQ